MAEYLIQDTTLTAIAEAIRGKTGGEDVIAVSAMAEQIAAIETGGGSREIKYKIASVTAVGNWGERVSANFGFVPDVLFVFPDDVNVNTRNSVYFAVSSKFATAAGSSVSTFTTYTANATSSLPQRFADTNHGAAYIDGTDTNYPIYNADETGFNFGKTPAAGKYWVEAFAI